jgi:antitoxin (DNA-binding transcriptional repressor) of toxin-antitoxin stability system
MCHMKTISIRELHEQTGQWVRQSAEGEIYITDRGRLVAKMMAVKPLPQKPFFADPTYTRAFLRYRNSFRGGTDATEIISQERDREVE